MIRKLSLFAVSHALLLSTPQVCADTNEQMYSIRELTEVGNVYSENLGWNIRNVLMSELTPQERQQIGHVQFTFPITSSANNNMFSFYSNPSRAGGTVTLPVYSIKFFDDWSLAYSELSERYSNSMPALVYLTLLQGPKDVFPCDCRPTSLEAVGLDPEEIYGSRSDQLAQNILKSAMMFIAAHELGHIYYRNVSDDSTVADRVAREIQADAFATELMRRIGVAPVGMVFWFLASIQFDVYPHDFSTDAAWRAHIAQQTHPVTEDRINSLSEALARHAESFARKEPNYALALRSVRNSAENMRQLAGFLRQGRFEKIESRDEYRDIARSGEGSTVIDFSPYLIPH